MRQIDPIKRFDHQKIVSPHAIDQYGSGAASEHVKSKALVKPLRLRVLDIDAQLCLCDPRFRQRVKDGLHQGPANPLPPRRIPHV